MTRFGTSLRFHKANILTKFHNYIHAIRPGLSGTVPYFDTLSQRPGDYEIVPEKKIKSTDFLRPIEREGFVINDKCCICCRVPIISGIPVVTGHH